MGYDLRAGDKFKAPVTNADLGQQIATTYFAAGQYNAATYYQEFLYVKNFSSTFPVELPGAVSWLLGTSIVSFSGYTLLQVPPDTDLRGGDIRSQDVRDLREGLDHIISKLRESPLTGPNAFTYYKGRVFCKNYLNTKSVPMEGGTSWMWVKNC